MIVKNTYPQYESNEARREEMKKMYRMLLLQLSDCRKNKNDNNITKAS